MAEDLAAWRRPTAGEARWPVSLAVIVAIALQVGLPAEESLRPHWFVPGLEGCLLFGLVAANPVRLDRHSRWLRSASIVLIGVISVANAWSAGHLVRQLVAGTGSQEAERVLLTGAAIWLTNVIVFGLWYWELDRGGPVARAHGERQHTDFLFPQMANPELAPPEWEPAFIDYLYTSFTNAAAFSPTDVLPLTRWTKLAMLVQSAVSLTTLALVIARAVNTLR